MTNLGQLRAIEQNELDLMLSWRNDPKVRANMYTRHPISREEHYAWWDQTTEREDCQYFMYERESVPVGIVGFTRIDQVNSNCSWAFYASPEAPRGTGSRMEYLALELAFGRLCVHKLHCEVLAFNEAVIKLHQKFGFEIEGQLREHHDLDGKFVDVITLGLLAREWAAKRGEMQAKLLGQNRIN
ncbi:UDP-4-amino-4,6-dideoxy-N-acetyl-beta-L-altrosamine N-acetyltransferase [Qipengyuania flava]|nr:UDP-4-amino-4,6-dideoxy-N-acetyl-beta-L-altrosamine N-acetyltransferase [Qipengyuania flava]